MATRHPNDFNSVINWSAAIEQIPNQTSFIKNKNLFDITFTNQTAVLFDRILSQVTLLPASNRRGGDFSYGKDDKVETYSLPLSYFRYNDTVTKQDFLDKRKAGTQDENDTAASVMQMKLTNGRRAIDQTHEYMMLQAIKGNCVTPDGTSIADMFTLFNETQIVVDFDLGTAATDVDAKISELKDAVVRNIKTGGVYGSPMEVLVGRDFFNKLKNHPAVQQAYLNSVSNIRYREDLANYSSWGISDVFEYQGVVFMVYSAVFNLPDGSTEVAVEANDGHAIPNIQGASLFRGVYGPSQRIDSDGGAEVFAFEFNDGRGFTRDLMMETAPLFYATKPLALVKVTTST